MPQITAEVSTGTNSIECESGRKLVLCLEDGGIDIMHRCGGNARCTTCRVEIITGEFGEMEDAERNVLATKTDLGPNTRLSCQIRVSGDAHIQVLNQSNVTGVDPGTRPEE